MIIILKILGGIFIILSSGVIGISLADNLNKRVILLNSIYYLLNDFSISIQYTATNTYDLIEFAYNNPQFKDIKFLKIFHDNLNPDIPFNTLWSNSINKDFSLKPPEKDTLISLGNSLGVVGCEESISNIHLAMNRLQTIQKQALNDYQKKANLFRWLGILIGVMITILLI